MALAIGRAPFVSPAEAQHLSRLQHVDFDFDTTGQASTLTFFNRDTGEVFLYVASMSGNFTFARSLTLEQLGGPLADQATQRLRGIPQLPTGTEPDFDY